jgi:hypothetical protein
MDVGVKCPTICHICHVLPNVVTHIQDVSKINLKCLENTYCEFVSEIWHVIVCYLTFLEDISVMYEGIMFSVEMQCYKIKFVKDRE